MMDDFWGINDDLSKYKKKLADLVIDSDLRPSTSPITITPGENDFHMHMRVASLGALTATMRGDPATGKLQMVGLALSSRELAQESN